jgi:hypothetical protein
VRDFLCPKKVEKNMSRHFWGNLNKRFERRALNEGILQKNTEALASGQFNDKGFSQREEVEQLIEDIGEPLVDLKNASSSEEAWKILKNLYPFIGNQIKALRREYDDFSKGKGEVNIDDKKMLKKLSLPEKTKAAGVALSVLKIACKSRCFEADINEYCRERLNDFNVCDEDIALLMQKFPENTNKLSEEKFNYYFSFIDRYGSASTRSEAKNLSWFSGKWFFDFIVTSVLPLIISPRKYEKHCAEYKSKSFFHCDYNRQINIIKKTTFLFVRANHFCQALESRIKGCAENKIQENGFFKENVELQLEQVQTQFLRAEASIKEIYRRLDLIKIKKMAFLSVIFKGAIGLLDELGVITDAAYKKILLLQIEFVRELKDKFIQWSNLTNANSKVTPYDRKIISQKIIDQVRFIQEKITGSNIGEVEKHKNNLQRLVVEILQHVNSDYFIKKSLSEGNPVVDGQVLIDDAFKHFVGGNVIGEEQLMLIKNKLLLMSSDQLTQYWIDKNAEHDELIHRLSECLDKKSKIAMSQHSNKYIEQAVDYFMSIRNEAYIEDLRNIFQAMASEADEKSGSLIMSMLKKLGLSKGDLRQVLLANKESVVRDYQLKCEMLRQILLGFKKPVETKINFAVNEMVSSKAKEIDQVKFKIEHWDVVEKILKEADRYVDVKTLVEDLSRLRIELSYCEQKIRDFECEEKKGSLFSLPAYGAMELLRQFNMEYQK